METDYRDFWEFPYADGLKAGMLFSFVQARAVLAWFRQLASGGRRRISYHRGSSDRLRLWG